MADGRMKVNLTGLPNKPRAVAWPLSARTLRRAVKSVNERDPRRQLRPRWFFKQLGSQCEHSGGTATAKVEEGVGDSRSVWRGCHGLHAAYNASDNAMQHRKVKLIAQTDAQFRLRAVTRPHEAGIPSRRTS